MSIEDKAKKVIKLCVIKLHVLDPGVMGKNLPAYLQSLPISHGLISKYHQPPT